MKVHKQQSGWYEVTLNNGNRFLVCQTGTNELPWNTFSWHPYFKCFDELEYCTKTKKEAIKELALLEK